MTAPRLRKRISLWAIAIGALLLVWAGSLIYLKYPRHYPSTGDALLDAYLAVANNDGEIPKDKLPKLEARFGSDPHYWELLFTSLTLYSDSAEYVGEKDYVDPIDEYIEQVRQGKRPMSVPILKNYVARREFDWRREYNDSDPPSIAQPTNPTGAQVLVWQAKVDRAASGSIDQIHGGERDKLYAELTRLSPLHSETYYRLARLEYMRNHYSQALDYIARGNLSPHQLRIRPYPFEPYRRAFDAMSPLRKHPRIALLAECDYTLTGGIGGYSAMQRVLCFEAVAKNDRRGLNILHAMTCALGRRAAADTYPGESYVSVATFEVHQAKNLPGLSHKQITDLTKLETLLNKQETELHWIDSNSPMSHYLGSNVGLLAILRGPRYYEETPSTLAFNDEVWKSTEYRKRVLPLYDQIATFDFVTMSFKP